MTVKITSIGLKGLEGYRVEVEVHLLPDQPSMVIVGLPDASVREAKERVLAAMHSLGNEQPSKKIIVNLSPPEQKKNGPLFDLAMVIGILKASGIIKERIPQNIAFLGALSLDGSIRSVDGLLSVVLAAKRIGIEMVYLPEDSSIPISQIPGIRCIAVRHVKEVLQSLSGQELHPLTSIPSTAAIHVSSPHSKRDFRHILGHQQAKRALEIAAAGGHHVFMSGPPGCGKSLLSETFPSILPTLSDEESLEVMSIYQLAQIPGPPVRIPPFRQPHHSASYVSIVGGGASPRPGEVSLAHHGVLFLDEMGEFTKKTLDTLRQPIETGKVTISRASGTVTYPARFLLLGAMNPCPCGYLGSKTHYCSCTPKQLELYRNRISGPIFDRMDIILNLQPVQLEREQINGESSENIRERVMKARERQYERYGSNLTNSIVPVELLLSQSLPANQKRMLEQTASTQAWSNRVQMKVIRLARTIADLKGEANITDEAIWEAVTLRRVTQSQKSSRLAR
ncbi:YifB family Mg chelatase-like AAA ATPase [Effusibacillus consociatus]|uniref:YifB family Mg chelatase-like AAA ATPase n=1 Tax=Effusibacillus consociatus TaxID=1117041 RepID=A0ABV9Q6M1_9BACL